MASDDRSVSAGKVPSSDDGTNTPVRIGIALVSAFVLGAGGLFFGAVLLGVTVLLLSAGFGWSASSASTLVLSLIFVQGVGCAGVALAYVRSRSLIASTVSSLLGTVPRREFSIGARLPSLSDLGIAVAGYVLAILGAIIGNIIVSTFVDAETGTNQAAEVGMQNPEVLLLLIPASFLLIGPGEELLFRGIVQGRLREVMSAVPAILITAAFFAGIHFFALTGGSLTGNLAALGVLTLPALVFGVAYEYTDNIAVPSLIHGAYNATLFSLLYAAIRFGGNVPSFWV